MQKKKQLTFLFEILPLLFLAHFWIAFLHEYEYAELHAFHRLSLNKMKNEVFNMLLLKRISASKIKFRSQRPILISVMFINSVMS